MEHPPNLSVFLISQIYCKSILYKVGKIASTRSYSLNYQHLLILQGIFEGIFGGFDVYSMNKTVGSRISAPSQAPVYICGNC